MLNLSVADFTLELAAKAQDDDDQLAPLFSDEHLGRHLWPAARALVNLLEERRTSSPNGFADNQLVVELGAGTGACGLAAAALGAPNVVLTDKPDLLPTLQANAAANSFSCSGVGCESLSWSLNGLPSNRLPCGADLVLASDCLNPVYGDDHAVALAATIRDLLHRARRSSAARIEPEALLAQTRRGVEVAERLFFAACARIGMSVELLHRTLVPVTGDAEDDALVRLDADAATDSSSVGDGGNHHEVVSLYSIRLPSPPPQQQSEGGSSASGAVADEPPRTPEPDRRDGGQQQQQQQQQQQSGGGSSVAGRAGGTEDDPPLLRLPSEVLTNHIFEYLPPAQVCRVGLTCRALREIAHSDEVWNAKLRKNLPDDFDFILGHPRLWCPSPPGARRINSPLQRFSRIVSPPPPRDDPFPIGTGELLSEKK